MNIEMYATYAITDYAGELKIIETLWLQDAKAAADQAQTQHPTARVIVVRWNSADNRDTVVYEATQPQAEPVKATVIADIEKEIKYSRATRDYDLYITIDGGLPQYIGSAANYSAGEKLCNEYVYNYLMDSQTIETAAELLMELPASAFCATCGNEGGCPDCELPFADPYAPMGDCAICGGAAWCTSVAGLLCPDHEGVLTGYYTVCELIKSQELAVAA